MVRQVQGLALRGCKAGGLAPYLLVDQENLPAGLGEGNAAHEPLNLFHARLHRVWCEDLELLLF